MEARNNCPLDAVSGVVEYLFPSPDGFNLAHNEYSKDPIGEIAREAQNHRAHSGESKHPMPARPGDRGGLRKILFLLDAVDHYRAAIRHAPDPASLDASALDFREGVHRPRTPKPSTWPRRRTRSPAS